MEETYLPSGTFFDASFVHQSKHHGRAHLNVVEPEMFLTRLMASVSGMNLLEKFLQGRGYEMVKEEQKKAG